MIFLKFIIFRTNKIKSNLKEILNLNIIKFFLNLNESLLNILKKYYYIFNKFFVNI